MVSNLYTGTFDTSETWAISEHFCFFAFWGVHVRVEVLFSSSEQLSLMIVSPFLW